MQYILMPVSAEYHCVLRLRPLDLGWRMGGDSWVSWLFSFPILSLLIFYVFEVTSTLLVVDRFT